MKTLKNPFFWMHALIIFGFVFLLAILLLITPKGILIYSLMGLTTGGFILYIYLIPYINRLVREKEMQNELLSLIPSKRKGLIAKAIQFAERSHAGQFRNGGEPQIEHLLRVGILAAHYAIKNCHCDLYELVISGLLHDTIEDTAVTKEQITILFGSVVAHNVVAVSHIEEEEPDEIYLARVAAGGKNAVLTKRFDRLDNLTHLANRSSTFRAKKLAEIKVALHIWQRIDPDGAHEIASELEKINL